VARVLSWRLVGAISVALGWVAIGGLSYAQQSEQANKEAGKDQQTTKQETAKSEQEPKQQFVEQIVVTAQKRSEDVQDVPVAISTLSGHDLTAITAGGPDIRYLSAREPSLLLESSFGRAFPRFYMRGLGNTDFDLNASQPVSMVVDDVVLENPVLKGMPLWDLDHIEVLRGPQGTLFGRNTDAGMVKFDSKRPTKNLDGEFRLSWGTYNTVDVDGGIGGALSDTLFARISLLVQSRNDWIKNTFTGIQDALGGHQEQAGRLQLLWQPNEKFSGLLNLHGWSLDGTARVFRANIIEKGTSDLVPGFRQDTVSQDGLNDQRIHGKGADLTLNYDLGAAALTSITGYETLDMYSRGDIDGGFGAVYAPPYGPGVIPFVSETADGIPKLDQLTEELRLASTGGGPFNWLAGIYYFHEKVSVDSFDYNSLALGNPQDGYAFQHQTADNYAAFASVDYAASEDWLLKAGIRYSHDKKDFSAERPDPTFQTPTTAPIVRNTDDNAVTWDVSAIYKINPDVHVYAKVATGFRPPSIQGRILFCADFDGGQNPATNCVSTAKREDLVSFEAGIKSILADHHLRLNLAAYDYKVDGQQVTAVGGQYNTATLLNVKRTNGYGLEADVEVIPTDNWWINAGISYNHTRFDDPNLTVAPCGGGCTIENTVKNGLVYIDGNSLPHAPDVIFGGSVNYQSSPVDRGYFATLDWSYYSKKYFFLYKSAEFQGDGYELGLRLGYGWNQGKYEVALYGRNITNKTIIEGGIDFDNLTGYTNEPRTVGVEFNVKF
jgi:iron complex outermembrane recepter protein